MEENAARCLACMYTTFPYVLTCLFLHPPSLPTPLSYLTEEATLLYHSPRLLFPLPILY
jgi:hypothetical protein